MEPVNTTSWSPEFREWVESRPESVRKLCYEFPIGTVTILDGRRLYLVGYNESDMLILSPIDPFEDYDGAMADKIYVCAAHLRSSDSASPDSGKP